MTSIFIVWLFSLIIAFAIVLKANKSKTVRKKVLFTAFSVFIFTAGGFINISELKGAYTLKNMQQFLEERQLPQMDSAMYVSYFNKTSIEYRSLSRNSIYHDIERIEYDIFGVAETMDYFCNRVSKQTLSVKFQSKRFTEKSPSPAQLIIKPIIVTQSNYW